jgi:hypothetical protein
METENYLGLNDNENTKYYNLCYMTENPSMKI